MYHNEQTSAKRAFWKEMCACHKESRLKYKGILRPGTPIGCMGRYHITGIVQKTFFAKKTYPLPHVHVHALCQYIGEIKEFSNSHN